MIIVTNLIKELSREVNCSKGLTLRNAKDLSEISRIKRFIDTCIMQHSVNFYESGQCLILKDYEVSFRETHAGKFILISVDDTFFVDNQFDFYEEISKADFIANTVIPFLSFINKEELFSMIAFNAEGNFEFRNLDASTNFISSLLYDFKFSKRVKESLNLDIFDALNEKYIDFMHKFPAIIDTISNIKENEHRDKMKIMKFVSILENLVVDEKKYRENLESITSQFVKNTLVILYMIDINIDIQSLKLLLKYCYDVRSKVAHGSFHSYKEPKEILKTYLDSSYEELYYPLAISFEIEKITRDVLIYYIENSNVNSIFKENN